jgi:hypothetical protein
MRRGAITAPPPRAAWYKQQMAVDLSAGAAVGLRASQMPVATAWRRMRAAVAVAAIAVLAALVVSQLALPPYLEQRVEDRLTAHGGRASVSLEALPALRLLFDRGDRLSVDGRGLRLDPRQAESLLFARLFEDLDRFDEVEVRLTASTVGPIAVRSFVLRRPAGGDSYRFRTRAATSPRALYRYAASRLSGSLGPLIAGATGGLLRVESRPIPIEIAGEIVSDGGRPRLTSATGTVAGIRAGLLVEVVAAAVTTQL